MGWIVFNSFVFVEFEEGGGALEFAGFAVAALGFEGAELVERFLELAGEALRVHAECRENAVRLHDARVAAEELGFEMRDAVHAPRRVCEFLDELTLGWSLGLVFLMEFAAVLLVGGAIFAGYDGSAAGESMGDGVLRRALAAGLGARAGGVERVGAIGGGAMEIRIRLRNEIG